MFLFLYIISFQILFSSLNVIARENLRQSKPFIKTISQKWFIFYYGLRLCALALKLYAIWALYLGRLTVVCTALMLLFSTLLGRFYLHEKMTKRQLAALILIMIALLIQWGYM